MSVSTVITRNLGRLASLQLLRKIAVPSRELCLHLRPSTTPVVSVINRRLYSDKATQETKSDRFYEQQHSDDQNEKERQEAEEEYEHTVKDQILNASLNHVKEHGWTKHAIEAGAATEGLSAVAHGMFDRGGAEIVDHFYKKCNAELAEYLRRELERLKAEGEEKPRIRPFIQDAVETRLKMIIPYQSIWKEALGIQTLPQNAPESWKNLLNLCDDIWYYAGDRSTDFDWYTKRFSLAAIYKATEIYMLQDSSPDFQDTWSFLDNRLNDLKSLASVQRSLEPLKEGIIGLCKMGRNMAGLNSRDR